MNPLRAHERRFGTLAAQHAIAACINGTFGEGVRARDIDIVRTGAKPTFRIAGTALGDPKIDFSISHAQGVAVGVAIPAGEGRIGVDIEAVRIFKEPTLRAFLTPREYRVLSGRPKKRALLATLYWCIKEAYTKALGTGLLTHPARIELTKTLNGFSLHKDGKSIAAEVRWARYHPNMIIAHVVIPHG